MKKQKAEREMTRGDRNIKLGQGNRAREREELLTMALRKPLSRALRAGTAIPPAAPHSSLKTSSSSPSS